MNRKAREIRYFFYSQHFSDGLRITAAILLPALLSFYFNAFEIGFTISLGAICVSITDAPGPFSNRRKGMWFCMLFVLVVAVTTALVRSNHWLLGIEIVLFSFFFSLFSVYGNRAAGVGNAAILVMILTMDQGRNHLAIVPHSLYILAGGIWYLALTWAFYRMRPYRAAQRFLGDCLREVAAYLFIKGKFYDAGTGLEENYQNMIAQQVVVSEKQDAVRELFFKTRRIVTEKDAVSKKLVQTFVHAVDLFEDITATYHDYKSIRQRFEHTGILLNISMFIKKMSAELDVMGIAIQSNKAYEMSFDAEEQLGLLKSRIDEIGKSAHEESTIILKKILVNMRRIIQRLQDMQLYFDKSSDVKKTNVDHTLFISYQSLDPKILWNNLSMQSAVFRHSLRVAIACTAGYAVARLLAYGQHSYWILLTVAFILKPAFGLTRQRNIDRIIGTLAGGLIGVLVMVLVQNITVQFLFLVVFMVGAYSMMRTNYIAMVIYTTAYVLIMFRFLGIPFLSVAQERILDTVIGCAIAFSTSYFLFPVWEAEQLKNFMAAVLRANAAYLEKFMESFQRNKLSLVDYKLARKNVYVQAANLAAAFRRMTSEPRSKQYNRSQVQLFVVENHLLFSNIANLIATADLRKKEMHSGAWVEQAGRSVALLRHTADRMMDDTIPPPQMPALVPQEKKEGNLEELLVHKQLEFIYRLCEDIDRNAQTILAA